MKFALSVPSFIPVGVPVICSFVKIPQPTAIVFPVIEKASTLPDAGEVCTSSPEEPAIPPLALSAVPPST